MAGNGPLTGRTFNNRYQLGERIGVGGMAEVYSAQDMVLGRIVAVSRPCSRNTPPTPTSRVASVRRQQRPPTFKAPT